MKKIYRLYNPKTQEYGAKEEDGECFVTKTKKKADTFESYRDAAEALCYLELEDEFVIRAYRVKPKICTLGVTYKNSHVVLEGGPGGGPIAFPVGSAEMARLVCNDIRNLVRLNIDKALRGMR